MTGQQVKAWREAAGMTQDEAAAHIGVTARTIRNWESGAVPVPELAGKFIAALKQKAEGATK